MADTGQEKPHQETVEMLDVRKLESEETTEFSDIGDQKLLRKIDLHIIPMLTILYLLSFIDRANIVSVFKYMLLENSCSHRLQCSRGMQKSRGLIKR